MGSVGILRDRITSRCSKALKHPGIPTGRTFGRGWEGCCSPSPLAACPFSPSHSSPLFSVQNPFRTRSLDTEPSPSSLEQMLLFPSCSAVDKSQGGHILPSRAMLYCQPFEAFVTLSWWTLPPSNEGTGQGVSGAESPWSLVVQALNQSRGCLILLQAYTCSFPDLKIIPTKRTRWLEEHNNFFFFFWCVMLQMQTLRNS